MANLSNWVFFSEESTEQVSNYLANPNNAGAITVQVEQLDNNSIINIYPEAMNDLTSPESYFPMKCVCLDDFKTYSTITRPGLYMMNFSGLYRLRFVSNGPVGGFKVYGVAVD